MRTFTGSEKQIAWAEKIFTKFESLATENQKEDLEKAFENHKDAKFWIDRRDYPIEVVLEDGLIKDLTVEDISDDEIVRSMNLWGNYGMTRLYPTQRTAELIDEKEMPIKNYYIDVQTKKAFMSSDFGKNGKVTVEEAKTNKMIKESELRRLEKMQALADKIWKEKQND